MKSPRIVTVPRAVPAQPEDLQQDEPSSSVDIVRPMPRRQVSHSISELQVALPRARRVAFKAGILRTSSRLFVWLWGFLRFYSGNIYDGIRGRGGVQARAVRLRRAFEGGGPTFAKLAQQLSMRADMLPYAYCAELSKMLDQAAAFPTEEAIAIIERNLKRPLNDVFKVFDPKPIGSASLACVYQAQLKTGERVAVKVRRPGIGPLVSADLRAMDWILILGETLTIIPPGVTRAFRQEFETILFNEMNFRTEARHTALFRQRAAKRKKGVTAPKVYFEYCTEEVMVSELVSGVWMWELMAAVDRDDQEFLAKVREIGIEPKSLARKLVRVMQQEVQEELFFHADPHPANLVVMANNGICFLDFGAIGRFSTQTRKTIRQFQYHMIKGDIGRMANCALSLLGPLPPMDVEGVLHEFEKIYAEAVYAMKSPDAEWWEKSAAQGWLRFLEVARQYSIPAGVDTIQFFRTTFAYDAVIMRLHKDLDVTKEWEAYAKEAAKESRRRVVKSFEARRYGLTDMDFVQIEEFGDVLTQFLFRLQQNVENPIVRFRNIVGKIAYIFSLLLKVGVLIAGTVALGYIADAVSKRWFNYDIDWAAILQQTTTFGWVQFTLILIVFVIVRRIIIRLNVPDQRLDPES
jgi:predicted unusual protein kinase regulating ubiquinone biosynthesis (AarF/ABC1/UbiB family)